jgi:Zn-dependent peptidase ImmA (M78 family)
MFVNIAEILSGQELNVQAAAKKTGMDVMRLHELVRGAEPNLAELRKFADLCKVPMSALLNNESKDSFRFQFRKPGLQTKPHEKAKSKLIETMLSKSLGDLLPMVADLPSNKEWLVQFSKLIPRVENAEIYASQFRELFPGLSEVPLLDLPNLVANYLNVFLLLHDNRDIEGASAIVDKHAFVFVSYRTFRPRMLFTLAHEIGHLVAQRGASERAFFSFDCENELHAWGHAANDEERFANAFATSLLLPRSAVLQLIKAIRSTHTMNGPLGDIEICYLARFFGVSFEVAGRRCEDLGLLPRGGAFTLYAKLNENHQSPEKRADEVGIRPREEIIFGTSDVLLHAALCKVRDGTFSLGKVAESLNVPLSLLVARNSEGWQ